MRGSKIVTICGSMRFYEEMLAHAGRLTVQNVIVLMPFAIREGKVYQSMLDQLHRRKIDMSQEILVVNSGGYIGESTQGEIAYARATGKVVTYVHEQGGEHA